jgi:hypothetical protein
MANNKKSKQNELPKSEDKNGYKTIFIVFILVSFAYVIPASFNSISTAIGTGYNRRQKSGQMSILGVTGYGRS